MVDGLLSIGPTLSILSTCCSWNRTNIAIMRPEFSHCLGHQKKYMSYKREVWNAILNTKGNAVLPLLFSMQQLYGYQLTVLDLYVCHKAIAVRWHLYVCCIVRKGVKESCPIYLIWFFQPLAFIFSS